MKADQIWCRELFVTDEDGAIRIMADASREVNRISIFGKGDSGILMGISSDIITVSIFDIDGNAKAGMSMGGDGDVAFYPIEEEQEAKQKQLEHRIAKMHGEFVEEMFRKGRS